MHAIELEAVTKRYAVDNLASLGVKNLLLHLPETLRAVRRRRFYTAVEALTLDVPRGECLGLIGRNGSGKSTTLGLIAGVLRPSEGRVHAPGRVCPLLELGAGFHHELSGRENVVLNAVLLGMRRREALSRMDAIIAFAELGGFIDQPLRSYSSGMVARLGFAVAVHLDPEILLVDEVLAVGDEHFQQKCLRKMEEFRASGVTIVFVSHDMEAVARVSSRVAFLNDGKLEAVGEPRAVISRYRLSCRD